MSDNNIKPLNISIKRGVINGKMKELLSYEEYVSYGSSVDNNSSAVLVEDGSGDTLALPIRGKISGNPPTNTPGIYDAGCIDFVVLPDKINKSDYVPVKVVEMNNKEAIKDILETKDTLSRLAEPWITTPDKITEFPINEGDQPEMICLKTALNAKQIDFDKYSVRFGENSPNDKRQLKNNSVTLNILKRFCEKCDMEAVLTLRDKNPNVPNPIGREITVSLTDSYSDE